ncbi:hypothetical protein OPV22_020664 [Ensete ventricosum]|uniref:Uncharacterized protein n=1 Tax=Ensete ventricosum TaxID=4639 RepID=A0AAV8QFE0_ENSVE|nr:hypothetical protein OPV22_020664 [Ensete ventricosum]
MLLISPLKNLLSTPLQDGKRFVSPSPSTTIQAKPTRVLDIDSSSLKCHPPDAGGFMRQLECNFLGPMSNQPTSLVSLAPK